MFTRSILDPFVARNYSFLLSVKAMAREMLSTREDRKYDSNNETPGAHGKRKTRVLVGIWRKIVTLSGLTQRFTVKWRHMTAFPERYYSQEVPFIHMNRAAKLRAV